jgi:hypothetical protein
MLPNASQAVVDPSKVRDYLLSSSHPIGGFKSVVFLALGYTRSEWVRLRDDLLTVALSGTAELGEENQFGRKYMVSGTLRGPNGREGVIRTVWLIENAQSAPRFLNGYPE